jgi:hypothetical protein
MMMERRVMLVHSYVIELKAGERMKGVRRGLTILPACIPNAGGGIPG